ncbi:MAG: sugar ABC transporter permease [Spirochaetes bacterium GWF1_51_8]|nr:MAG: sugar ABC transporter permease [Spirochaetes bacterium GWF1_51_8]
MREEIIKKILIYAGGLFLFAFAVSPFLWMMVVSLSTSHRFLVDGGFQFTWEHYIGIFTQSQFLSYFVNSLIIAVVVSLVVSIFASFAGYAVSRIRFPGRVAIPLFVLAMSMFPQVSIVGYLADLFGKLNLINTHFALILPYIAWTVPLALWINMSYFTQIPLDLDKAALVDGASRTKTLVRIILPIALPGIFSSFLLVFIACFNEFLFAMMLTSSPDAQTIPVGIASFSGLYGETSWGMVMAASFIASLPLIILTLVFQRYIVQGLAAGSVKG